HELQPVEPELGHHGRKGASRGRLLPSMNTSEHEGFEQLTLQGHQAEGVTIDATDPCHTWRLLQASVQVVGPAVIGTHELLDAPTTMGDARCVVPAYVEEGT